MDQPEGGPIDLSQPSAASRRYGAQYAAPEQNPNARAVQTGPALDSSNGTRAGAPASVSDAVLGEMMTPGTPGEMAPGAPLLGAAPAAVAVLKDKARASLKTGDSKTALTLLRKALAANPDDAEADSLLAMAYSRERDYRAAAATADAGLRVSPDNVPLLDAQAYAFNRLKDFRRALAAADRAVALKPHDAVAHFNRAAALAGLGDRAGALEALRAAASLSPRFAPFLKAAQNRKDLSFLYEDDEDLPMAGRLFRQTRWWLLGTLLGGACALPLFLLRRARRRRTVAAPDARRPAPCLLAEHYELGPALGEGGMGVVYEGTDVVLNRRVAIKRMREEIRADERERRRFLSEARAVAKLRHPHIVDILEIIEDGGEVYLVFEYVAGRTLEQRIAEGRLPFAEARALFQQVGSALDYAHAHGVIHRDLKPSNIMTDEEGLARVMDFGVARILDEVASTRGVSRGSTIAGTPPYMAPEQEQGRACRESDVYALAICLYEALTGERPFGGLDASLLMSKLSKTYAPASEVAAGLPQGLDAVFARAFEPDPTKRYPSARELVRELDTLACASESTQ
ncbi:MAG: protein kinase [Elusimicrobia bacterium]|nr:protein kinase [Elusimicrobiota bacterium]